MQSDTIRQEALKHKAFDFWLSDYIGLFDVIARQKSRHRLIRPKLTHLNLILITMNPAAVSFHKHLNTVA